jgi:hypothetical protein
MVRSKSTPDEKARAVRAVNRVANLARISGFVMIVLGGIFAIVGIRDPISPGFFISVAVLVNGIIEWRGAAAMRALDEKAPGRLATNQVALAVELVVYAVWQIRVFDPEMIDQLLTGPMLAPVLELYPPDVVLMMRDMLPQFVRLFYNLVGVVALVGCGGTAWYYRSRLRHLLVAKSDTPPELP